MTGLSARQLQLWDTGGLLAAAIPSRRTPAGGFTERRYTPIELFELLVLADLRRRGFSVQQLHSVLDALKRQFATRLYDATGGGDAVQLLTDGSTVYARTSNGEFYNLLKAPAQPLLVVGDEGLLKRLTGKVRPKKSGRSARGRRPASG